MANQTQTLQITDTTATSASIQLNLNTTSDYSLSCVADLTNSTVFSRHEVAYGLRGNSIVQAIHGLLPETGYQCCISTADGTECDDLTTRDEAGSGMSLAGAGALGGVIALVLIMVVAVIVVTIVVSVMVTVKKKRAIARAKSRPVLRTDSVRYNRRHANKTPEVTASTPSARHTSSPLTTATIHHHNTLPTLTQGKSPPTLKKQATKPQLKPPLPLKPPIAKKQSYPLRRAKSQPANFEVSPEHIYDDAEISFKARRIVSRDNVAYSQAYGEEELGEYELYY